MFGHELTETQLASIFARIPNSDMPDECWLYQGVIHPEGYGMYNGRRVHRLMLERHLGRALGEGMLACHKCVKNRRCVNPEHLYEGTRQNNGADLRRDGTAYRGGGRRKLTAEQRLEVAKSPLGSYKLAAQYDMDASTIRYIKRVWRAIQG